MLKTRLIDIEVGKRVCNGKFKNKDKEFEIFGFLIQLLSEKFLLNEHSKTGWFSLNEMASLQMAGSDKQIVQKLKEIFVE